MLCSNCNERPSSMHYVSVVNGVKIERYLCSECAKKMGMASFSPFSWGDMLSYALPAVEQARCGACGMTTTQFKRAGFVGCERCYTDLRKDIEPILRRVQKNLIHAGRTPVGFAAAKLPQPGATGIKEKNERERLQEELRAAIEREEFEKAAALRDRIKALGVE